MRTKGAHTENVSDGVGVPPFGEHGDADHAPDVLAELARLADRVHHFAEQIFIGEVLGVASGEEGAVVVFELVYFTGGDLLEVVAHCLAGFELRAVHQNRVRTVQPSAIAIVVAKDGQLPGLNSGLLANLSFPSCMKSKTSLETLVLLQMTMKTGGVTPRARASAFCSHRR